MVARPGSCGGDEGGGVVGIYYNGAVGLCLACLQAVEQN